MVSWQQRRSRMATDPDYRDRLSRDQMASRKRRRAREWQRHVTFNGTGVCYHTYPNDRRCWRTDEHGHA